MATRHTHSSTLFPNAALVAIVLTNPKMKEARAYRAAV
jgi:hypothetical protein